MICGHTPFHASNNDAVYQNIMQGEVNFSKESADNAQTLFSKEAIDLIRRLLCREAKYRLQ